MKTMYIAETLNYTDCEGRYTAWEAITEYTTMDKAIEAAKATKKGYTTTGTWHIVARTMDEATFTVKDEVVMTYDYYKEVERPAAIAREIGYAKEALAKAEAIKPKTERGEARKAKAIAEAKAWLARAEAKA